MVRTAPPSCYLFALRRLPLCMYFLRHAGEPNLSFRPPLLRFAVLRFREVERDPLRRRLLPELEPPKVRGGDELPAATGPRVVAIAPPGSTGLARRCTAVMMPGVD